MVLLHEVSSVLYRCHFLSLRLWSKKSIRWGYALAFTFPFSGLSLSLLSFPFSLLPSLSLSLFNDWRAQCFATSCTKAAINSRSLHSPLCFLNVMFCQRGCQPENTSLKEKQHSSAWLPDTYCLSSALILLVKLNISLCHSFSLCVSSILFENLVILKSSIHQASAGSPNAEESVVLKSIFYESFQNCKCCWEILAGFFVFFFFFGGGQGTLWVGGEWEWFGEVLGNPFFPHPIINAEAGNLIPGLHSTLKLIPANKSWLLAWCGSPKWCLVCRTFMPVQEM